MKTKLLLWMLVLFLPALVAADPSFSVISPVNDSAYFSQASVSLAATASDGSLPINYTFRVFPSVYFRENNYSVTLDSSCSFTQGYNVDNPNILSCTDTNEDAFANRTIYINRDELLMRLDTSESVGQGSFVIRINNTVVFSSVITSSNNEFKLNVSRYNTGEPYEFQTESSYVSGGAGARSITWWFGQFYNGSDYNGTPVHSYPMILQNSSTASYQLNKSLMDFRVSPFQWGVTASTNQSTSTASALRDIAFIDFGLCNDSFFAYPVMNISVVDEISGEQLNTTIDLNVRAQDLDAGNSDFEVLTNELSSNHTYEFCMTPSQDYVDLSQSLSYTPDSSAYTDIRQYFFNDLRVSHTMFENLVLYALNDTESTDITVTISNVYGQVLEGVTIRINRQSDNVTIQQKQTDFSGTAKFNLNDDLIYDLHISHPAYKTFMGSLNPAFTSYDQVLELPDVADTDFFVGLTYEFSPSTSDFITPSSTQSFGFNISSSIWTITNCRWDILFNNTVLNSSTGWCSSSSGYANMTIPIISAYTLLDSRAVVEFNGTNVTIFQLYQVNDVYTGNFSLVTVVNDVKSFDKAGFNGFAQMFIALLVVIGITLGVGRSAQITNEPEKMLLLFTLLMFIASFFGFVTVDFVPVAGQYFIATILGVMTMLSFLFAWRAAR